MKRSGAHVPLSLLLVPHRAADETDSAQTMGRMLEVIDRASAGGFHACFFPEHHLRQDDYVTSPVAVATFVAGRWPQLAVGTGVALPALHNPLILAEQLATLDVLSDGRLYCFGVGLGNVRPEFDAIGVPHGEMLARFTASLDILQRLWRGEEVSADLGTLKIRNALLSPKPRQAVLPMAIGAMSDVGIRRAARLGLPWMTDPMHPVEKLEEWAHLYWSHAGGDGRIILMRQAWTAPSVEAAIQEWWPHARDQIFSFSLTHDRLPGDPAVGDVKAPQDLHFEDFASRFLLGPPADVVAGATRMATQLGASDVVVRMGFGGGPSHDAVLESVSLLGAQLATRTERT